MNLELLTDMKGFNAFVECPADAPAPGEDQNAVAVGRALMPGVGDVVTLMVRKEGGPSLVAVLDRQRVQALVNALHPIVTAIIDDVQSGNPVG